MDHDSFDRLAVIIDRLRDRATRRATLRLLLGGLGATGASLAASNTAARPRDRARCRNLGAACTRDRQCCTRTCLANRCRISGSQQCGNRTCLPGFECCRNDDGDRVCTPNGFPYCCGSFSFPDGYRCCRSSGGGVNGACPSESTCCPGQAGAGCCPRGMTCCDGGCCPDGMICCDNGCCPDGFRCGASGCVIDGSAAVGTRRTAKPRPFTAKIDIEESDMIAVAPTDGEASPAQESDMIAVAPTDGEASPAQQKR